MPGCAYRLRPFIERLELAKLVRASRTRDRERIAREIEEGGAEMWTEEGLPRRYWHLCATLPPDAPAGERGTWQATASPDGVQGARWQWQRWTPKKPKQQPPEGLAEAHAELDALLAIVERQVAERGYRVVEGEE